MRNLMIGLVLGCRSRRRVVYVGGPATRRHVSRRRDRRPEALLRVVRERRGAFPPREVRSGREVGHAPASPRLRRSS